MKLETERTAIDSAYSEQVTKLFDIYIMSISGGDPQAECLKRFRNALEIVRKTHTDLLSILKENN